MLSLKRSLALLLVALGTSGAHCGAFAATEAPQTATVPAVVAETPAPVASTNATQSVDPAITRGMLALLASVLASATANGAGDPGLAIERALERLWRNPNSQAQVTRMIENALTQSLNQPDTKLDPETRALVRSVVQSAVLLIKREMASGLR